MSQRGGVCPISASPLARTPEQPSPVPGESPGTGREGLHVLGLLFTGFSVDLVDFQCLTALPGQSTCANPCPAPVRGGREAGLRAAVPQPPEFCSYTLRCHRNLHFYPSLCNALGFFFCFHVRLGFSSLMGNEVPKPEIKYFQCFGYITFSSLC